MDMSRLRSIENLLFTITNRGILLNNKGGTGGLIKDQTNNGSKFSKLW